MHIGGPTCYLWLHINEEGFVTVSTTTDYEIERDILIEAPVEVVWRTVTEPDQMTLWFADKVDLVVEPGAHGYMGFGEQGGPVVVEAVEPPDPLLVPVEPPGRRGADADQLPPRRVHPHRPKASTPASGSPRAPSASLDRPDIDKAKYAEEHNHGWGVFLDRLAGAVAEPA